MIRFKQYTQIEELEYDVVVEKAEYQGREVKLNDPFRLPTGSKKKTTSKKKASPKKTTAPKVPAGLETRTQIKQFQLANGLLPTGLLDEATLEKAKK